jgi:hypothetical protein
MIPACDPVVRESAVGWLATTPTEHPYRIGVVGRDEDDAREQFGIAFAGWEVLHERAEAAT